MIRRSLLYLFYLPILVFQSSCQNTGTNGDKLSEAKVDQDSLNRERRKAEQRDSILKVEEKKAISNILFGISEKEFEKQQKIFLKKSEKVDFIGDDGEKFYDYFIGNYEFISIDPLLYQKKLYGIEIKGEFIKYENYNSEMPVQKEALVEVLTEKFGAPEFVYPLKAWHTIEKDERYESARWRIGKKIINTYISNRGLYYTYDMSIFLPEINGRIIDEQRAKEKIEKQKGVDNL